MGKTKIGYNGILLYGVSGCENDSMFLVELNNRKLNMIRVLDYKRQSRYKFKIAIKNQYQKSVSNQSIGHNDGRC